MNIDSKLLLAQLQAAPAPLSFAKLKKQFVNKKAGVTEAHLLEALAGEGIFSWPKKSYWHIDPVISLHSVILALCAKKALKKTEIKVKDRSKEVAAAVDQLLLDRKLLKYPALAGTGVLLVTAGASDAYWEYVREVVAAKLKKAGIEEAGLEERLWEILPTLEPELNVPVSCARLRRAMGSVDKRRFDEAALRLREQRRVYLSQHDHPMGLNEAERDFLIDGKDGRYYVAISRLG